MGKIRIVGPGKTRGYPYPVCKKKIVGPDKTRGYPYPICKKRGYFQISILRYQELAVYAHKKKQLKYFVSCSLFLLHACLQHH